MCYYVLLLLALFLASRFSDEGMKEKLRSVNSSSLRKYKTNRNDKKLFIAWFLSG